MKNKKLIYIAGPMSGIAEYNYPMFEYWEKYWISRGYKVINPAKQFFGVTFLPWWLYLICDILILHFRNVTHIFMLQGWESSTGACIEILVADKLNKKILYENPLIDQYFDPDDYA